VKQNKLDTIKYVKTHGPQLRISIQHEITPSSPTTTTTTTTTTTAKKKCI